MTPELARCHRLSSTVSRLSDGAEHAGGCLRSALGLPPMAGKEGKRIGQKEKLSSNAVSTKASANAMGSFECMLAYENCPKLE